VLGGADDAPGSAWPFDAAASPTRPPHPATNAARYTTFGVIGAGGMGQVLLARDEVLGREVALKVIRPDHAATPVAAQRLADEARLTAGLDHPSIVAVHDLGRTADGAPYYVMRLVRGRALSEELSLRTTLDARLGLVRPLIAAVEALAYAHHRGVVHRDVKPSNVMLGSFGEVQVMDWGLAAPIGTRADHPIGTPGFMAPELARMEAASDRIDVFGIGMTLRAIITAERAPPPELAAIASACVDPEPTRRPSARALADDLARYLEGRRVHAYDYPLATLLGRLVRRWRVPLAIVIAALVVLTVVLVKGNRELVAERDRAETNLAHVLSDEVTEHVVADRLPEAERIAAELMAMPAESARAVARGVRMIRHAPTTGVTSALPAACSRHAVAADGGALVCLDDGSARFYALGEAGATLRWTRAVSAARAVVLADVVVFADAHGHATRHALANGEPLGTIADWTPTSFIASRTRAVGYNSGFLVAELTPGQTTRIDHPCDSRVNVVALTPDERTWVVACADGEVLVGPLGERPVRRDRVVLPFAPSVIASDGIRLVWGDTRGHVGVTTLGTGETRWQRVMSGPIAAFASGPNVLWVALADGTVHVLDDEGDDLTTLDHDVRTLIATDDGALTIGSAITRWSTPSRRPHRLVLTPEIGLTGAVPSPDATRLAASTADGRVIVVGLDGTRLRTLRPSNELVKPIAWRGDQIAGTWMEKSGLIVLATTTDAAPGRLPGSAFRRVLTLAGDRLLAIAYAAGTTVYEGQTALQLPALAEGAFVDAATGDGRFVVLVPEIAPTIVRLDATTLALETFAMPSTAHAADISADGRRVVLAREAAVVLVDLTTRNERALAAPPARVLDIALSADERFAIAGLHDGRVVVWSLATGALHASVLAHAERVAYVETMPDGTAVSASWDGTARLWDLNTLR